MSIKTDQNLKQTKVANDKFLEKKPDPNSFRKNIVKFKNQSQAENLAKSKTQIQTPSTIVSANHCIKLALHSRYQNYLPYK